MRPSFEETMFQLAEIWAKRATCNRLKTACVFADKDFQVLTSGYNGSPRGQPHCIDPGVGCLMLNNHCVRTVHGEMNGIIQAARVGISLKGSTAYILHRPCIRCATAMIQAGVEKVLYKHPYEAHGEKDDVVDVLQAGRVTLANYRDSNKPLLIETEFTIGKFVFGTQFPH
jgi:dCMP deaminase